MRPDRALRRWWKKREYRALIDAAADALGAGRSAEAEERCGRALALAEEIYGPADVEVVLPLYVLGSIQLGEGRLGEARASSERAIAIAEAAPAASEPPLPRLLEQLAAILERLGEVEGEEALFRRMLAGYERMREPDPAELSAVLNRLGLLLGRQGRREEAAPLLGRALSLREAAFGPEHPRVAEALYNAATFRAGGGLAEAEAMLRRALAIVERLEEGRGRDQGAPRAGDATPGEALDPALGPSILHNLAVLREEQGDAQEAAALYERALAGREALVGPSHPGLRPALVRLARLRHAAGQPTAALPLYERALALALAEHGPGHPIPEAIRAWITEARSAS